MSKNNVYIYALSCPNSGLVRYIGKTNDPKKRLLAHLYKKDSCKKRSWILGLRKTNQIPIMDVIDEVPVSEWELKEIEYIKLFKSIGANLLNLTHGGVGCRANDYVKIKMRQANRKKRSKECGERMSIILKGKKRSFDTRLNYSRRQGGLPVCQYDAIGNFVKKWPFVNAVSGDFLPQNIYACLKGKQVFSGGFHWSYEEKDRIEVPRKKHSREIKVYQYSKNGDVIKSFSSIKDAAAATNISPKALSRIIDNKDSSLDFYWTKKHPNK